MYGRVREVGRYVNNGQYSCMTAKMKAALMPNSSMPSTASSAPIIGQCREIVTPEALA